MHSDILDYYKDEIAERNLLALLVIDNRLIDNTSNYLDSKDFFYPHSKAIYNIIIDLFQKYKEANIKQIEEEINKLPNISHSNYSLFLKQGVEVMSESKKNILKKMEIITDYINIVKNLAKIRDFLSYPSVYTNKIKSKSPDITKDIALSTINDFYQKAFDLTNFNQATSTQYTIKDIITKYREKFADLIENGLKSVVFTGFKDLDKKLGGLHKSDLILLAGRPSMGKTALSINILKNIASVYHKPVVFFSLEMAKEQLIERLISLHTNINLQNIRTGDLSQLDVDDINNTTQLLEDLPIVIDDAPNLTLSNIQIKAAMYKNKFPDLGCIIIDYLQLINSKTHSIDNRNQEISKITSSLKQLAKELDIPIILLSQLSRAPEKRSSHKPVLSDLRDSGAIEQDADVVIFIYREHKDNPKANNVNNADIIVAKHRNGPTGSINLFWEGEYAKFSNI